MDIRTKTCQAVLLALVTYSMTARADETDDLFTGLDKNGDGAIALDEVSESRRTFVERLLRGADANGDGQLSRSEFATGLGERELKPIAGVPPVGAGDSPSRQQFSPKQFFDRLDRNGDGKLSLAEFPESARERVKPLMERLSVDSITLDQFEQLRSGNPGNRPGPSRDGSNPVGVKPGRPTAGNGLDRSRGGLMSLIDADGNGRVSRAEWERLSGMFAKLDRNGDGELDPRELMSAGGIVGRPDTNRPARPAGSRPEGTKLRKPNVPDANRNSPAAFFQRLDRDGDGTLSKSETSRLPKPLVERLDRDGSGDITKDELEAARPNEARPPRK